MGGSKMRLNLNNNTVEPDAVDTQKTDEFNMLMGAGFHCGICGRYHKKLLSKSSYSCFNKLTKELRKSNSILNLYGISLYNGEPFEYQYQDACFMRRSRDWKLIELTQKIKFAFYAGKFFNEISNAYEPIVKMKKHKRKSLNTNNFDFHINTKKVLPTILKKTPQERADYFLSVLLKERCTGVHMPDYHHPENKKTILLSKIIGGIIKFNSDFTDAINNISTPDIMLEINNWYSDRHSKSVSFRTEKETYFIDTDKIFGMRYDSQLIFDSAGIFNSSDKSFYIMIHCLGVKNICHADYSVLYKFNYHKIYHPMMIDGHPDIKTAIALNQGKWTGKTDVLHTKYPDYVKKYI